MRLSQQGFTEEQFRWCFWGPTGSGGPESDAANAAGIGGGDNNGNDGGDGADRDAGRSGPSAGDFGGRDDDPMGMADVAAAAEAANAARGYGGDSQESDAAAAVAALDASVGAGGGSRPTTSPAQRGGLYSSALASTQPTATINAALSNMFGAPTSMVNGVPVTRGTPQVTDLPNYSPTNYGQEDLDRAIADLGRARDDAYSEPQFGINLPSLLDPHGIYGRIATAVIDPTAALADQLAEKGIATIDGQAVPASQQEIGVQGLDVATTGTPVSQGGRVAAYDPQINAVFDTNPLSGLNPFGAGVPQNINDLYSRARAVEEQDRARYGEGGDVERQPLVVPEQTPEEERQQSSFPAFTRREYTYQPYVGQFYTIPSRFTQPYGLLG